MKLSILASNARTDAVKIFTSEQLSIDAIVAAATIPFLFPAVEIDGDSYWGDGDLSALPPGQPIDVAHRLIIAGKPMTPCAARRLAANHIAMTPAQKPAQIHTIFDGRHRAGAALLTRPWTDWGELTDTRDRGRQRAEDWLLADHLFVDERSAVDSKDRYV